MTNPTPSAEERARLLSVRHSVAPQHEQDIRDDSLNEIRQAEQAARADERRKTLEEEAAYHTKEAASWDRVADNLKATGNEDAMHQAEGWAAYHESQAERLEETALAKSSEPGEAA